MNGLDFHFEKLEVSEPVGLSFHCFDFVVEPFKRTGTDPAVIPSQYATASGSKCVGNRNN